MDIYEYLDYGKEHRTTRGDLEKRTGMDDRSNRELIKHARTKEEIDPRRVILSASSRKSPGYWISDDLSEIDRFTAELKSRIRELHAVVVHCERYKLFRKSKGD